LSAFLARSSMSEQSAAKRANASSRRLCACRANKEKEVSRKCGSIGSVFNARAGFVKFAAQKTNEIFLKKSSVSVSGIIISGAGELKSRVAKSPFLSHLIKASVLCVVEVDYGGKHGFNQTIKKCADMMKRQEFENEDKVIEDAMRQMADDGDLDDDLKTVTIGFNETLKAIRSRVAKQVILSRGNYQFAIQGIGKNEQVKFAKNEIEKLEISKSMMLQFDKIETESFVGFFSKLCEENKVELKLIGNHSPITHSFARGLSGCIAILHYAVNIDEMDCDEQFENDSN